MRVTRPYNNEITIIKNFATLEEISIVDRYLRRFFNNTENNMTDEEFNKIKKDVKQITGTLYLRAQEKFYDSYGLDGLEFTTLHNFIRLNDIGISPHADDCQPGAQRVHFGAVLYWNDDYSGGELTYTNMNITYTPEAGDLVFHPATAEYTHGVNDVTSGHRYTSTMFIRDMLNEQF